MFDTVIVDIHSIDKRTDIPQLNMNGSLVSNIHCLLKSKSVNNPVRLNLCYCRLFDLQEYPLCLYELLLSDCDRPSVEL